MCLCLFMCFSGFFEEVSRQGEKIGKVYVRRIFLTEVNDGNEIGSILVEPKTEKKL